MSYYCVTDNFSMSLVYFLRLFYTRNHDPYFIISRYEAATINQTLMCRTLNFRAVPIWFIYLPEITKLLLVVNAAVNFPIYYFMGTAFRTAMHGLCFNRRTSPGRVN